MKLQNKLKELKSEIDENTREYKNYCKMVEEYSKFEMGSLGNVLAEIVSFYEGKKYVCKEVELNCHNEEYENVAGHERPISFKRLDLVDESDERTRIILPNNKIWDGAFYHFDTFGTMLDGTHYFVNESLPYLKDFIDYVIYYKMENGVSILEPEVLEELKKSFLAGYSKEEIQVKKVIN